MLLSRSYTVFRIYILAVRNTACGKRHTSRITSVTPLYSAVHLRRKLPLTAIVLVLLTDQFDAFFNPKIASQTDAARNTPPN